jgi:hypothetical protein
MLRRGVAAGTLIGMVLGGLVAIVIAIRPGLFGLLAQ